MSRTTARPMTGPAQAPIACRKRATSSTSSDGAKAASTEAARKMTKPASITGRRPKRSLSGPLKSWLTAKPAI